MKNIKILQDSLNHLSGRELQMAERFYQLFLEEFPDSAKLFSQTNMPDQYQRLADAIAQIVRSMDNQESVTLYLKELGRRHVDYGALDVHYESAGSCLLTSLEENLQGFWNDNVKSAWIEAWTFIKNNMISGSKSL